MKYYKVIAHRAHLGRGKSVPISFYIAANNAIAASECARHMRGVKHSRGVISCVPIDEDEYNEGRKISAYER